MKRLLPLLVVIVGLVLAGCTTDGGNPVPPTPSTSAPATTTAGASPTATATPTASLVAIDCNLPRPVVEFVVESPIEAASEKTDNGQLWCLYGYLANADFSIHMRRGVTPAEFDQWRDFVENPDSNDFTELSGFEDRGFWAHNRVAPIGVNAVAGLRGTTAVYVSGTYTTADKEKRLVSGLLDKLSATS